MRSMAIAALLLCLVVMPGCAGIWFAPVMPPQGGMFTAISGPMDTDVDQTTIGSRSGSASTICVLGMFAFGDASISAAAEDGNLSTVNHVDYSYLNVLGIYQSFTTIVYGD